MWSTMMGYRQAGKASDFDSDKRFTLDRRFESCYPSQSCELLLSVFSFLTIPFSSRCLNKAMANKAGRPVNPGVAQLVERVVWDHEAAGSNPVTWTILALSVEKI